MFTGLIETTGRIEHVETAPRGRRIRIGAALGADLQAGDSVAVNGVCLTATACDAAGFAADISPETLRVTTLGTLVSGGLVNLERPLRADGRVGGHFVLGHVDGIGRVAGLRPDGDCYWLDVDVPSDLSAFVISKGSIAIDGISLTVAALTADRIGVQIVPFTWTHTALHAIRAGDAVNLEVDVIGKYVARLLEHRGESANLATAILRQHP